MGISLAVQMDEAPSAARPLLDISQLEGTYNGVAIAIQGVSMLVQPRKVVVLLGRNGAGKPTTLRPATGFLPIAAPKITPRPSTSHQRPLHSNPPPPITHLHI